jgi:hypothetical protein
MRTLAPIFLTGTVNLLSTDYIELQNTPSIISGTDVPGSVT